MAQARVCDALSERRLVAVAWRARYAAGGGGGGFGGLGGGGLGGLGGNMGATHFRLWRGGVKPDHPTPRGRRPVPRGDLHDATNHDAVGEHVEVVVAPLAGWARSQGALEDQGIGHGRGRPHGGPRACGLPMVPTGPVAGRLAGATLVLGLFLSFAGFSA